MFEKLTSHPRYRSVWDELGKEYTFRCRCYCLCHDNLIFTVEAKTPADLSEDVLDCMSQLPPGTE